MIFNGAKKAAATISKLTRFRSQALIPHPMTKQPPRTSKRSITVTAIAATALGMLFMGSVIPTPLYPAYQSAFEFSSLMLTSIYAVYVLGNLTVLLLLGGLGDRIGKRKTALPSIALAALSTAAFAMASGVAWLLLGRFVSGLANGLVAGAATSWITDAQGDANAGARIATTANFAGLAVGSILSGVLAQVAPDPLVTNYIVYLVMLAGLGLAVLKAREDEERHSISFSDVWQRPRIAVPRPILRPFLSHASTAFAVFALLGFYAALIPSLLVHRLEHPSPVVSGAVVFQLFIVAAVTVVAGARLDNYRAVRAGLVLLVVGIGLLLGADLARSTTLLVLAASIGGMGAALGYRGSLGLVNAIAPPERRSEVISSYLIAVYCGNSLPVIGVGLLSMFTSLTVAHVVFAVLIALVAAIAFFEAGTATGSGSSRHRDRATA